MKKIYFLIMIGLVFFSCKKEKAEINHPPVAHAGNDAVITLPANTINLDGSSSTDQDNNITGFQWTKILGPSSNITNVNLAQTQVSNLVEGIYRFELKVTDAGGLFSKDTIQVTVNATIPINHPPVANAGNDTTITLPANTINLNGSKSTDPDNNITGYQWTKTSGPSSPNITNANVAQTQVSNLVEGVYQFELKVTDAGGLISKDTIQVTINQQTNTSSVDVYVTIVEYGFVGYWKNGQRIALTDGTKEAGATSLVVIGNDVYVAGNEYNGNGVRVAKYWKNGQSIPLTDGTKDAGAVSIAVVGNDVYVSGLENNVTKYWKNGQSVTLTDGTTEVRAYSIAVAGSDVYVIEGEFNVSRNRIAKYWKNGQVISLTDGTKDAAASSIAVVGSDVYVAGNEYSGSAGNRVAKYWKNGQAIALTDGTKDAAVNSIAVVGSDVYVAGGELNNNGIWVAKYWKNGNPVNLSDGTKDAGAASIVIEGSDVYVLGGTEFNGIGTWVNKYWKNGQPVIISDGTKASTVTSFFVVRR